MRPLGGSSSLNGISARAIAAAPNKYKFSNKSTSQLSGAKLRLMESKRCADVDAKQCWMEIYYCQWENQGKRARSLQLTSLQRKVRTERDWDEIGGWIGYCGKVIFYRRKSLVHCILMFSPTHSAISSEWYGCVCVWVCDCVSPVRSNFISSISVIGAHEAKFIYWKIINQIVERNKFRFVKIQ